MTFSALEQMILTQMTYAVFLVMDIGKFITYREKENHYPDPFQSLDQTGVGQLIQLAVEKACRRKFVKHEYWRMWRSRYDPAIHHVFPNTWWPKLHLLLTLLSVPIAKPRSCPSQNFNRTGCD